jgi:hypothetical protein
MLLACVLLRSLAVTPDLADCDRGNAVSVMQVPEKLSGTATCLMQGHAFVAGISIERDLPDGQRVKVIGATARRPDRPEQPAPRRRIPGEPH